MRWQMAAIHMKFVAGDPDPERQLRWVIDMTIGYRNGEGEPPDMFGMCVGYRVKQNVHVHYRSHSLSSVPRDQEGLLKWLYDRYEEKDRLLEYFHTNGHFPSDSDRGVLPMLPSHRISYDWMKVALFQGFFIVSAYFHYVCLIQPLVSMLFWGVRFQFCVWSADLPAHLHWTACISLNLFRLCLKFGLIIALIYILNPL